MGLRDHFFYGNVGPPEYIFMAPLTLFTLWRYPQRGSQTIFTVLIAQVICLAVCHSYSKLTRHHLISLLQCDVQSNFCNLRFARNIFNSA